MMLFPSQEDFQATLRRWGVNDDSTLVIYDDSRSALATRFYYLLGLYGFDMARVRGLDGGVPLNPANPALFVRWEQVYDDVVSRRDPGVVLVDAGPPRCTAVKSSAIRYRVGISPAPSTSFPWMAPIR